MNLEKKIKESGLKQSFIAKSCGLTDATFSQRLSGRSEWKLTELQGLAKALNLTGDEILTIGSRR